MKDKNRYTDEPLGKLKVVKDFLPPPEELVMPGRTQKVTIHLSEASIHFFKKAAQRNRTKYQRLIREVLDRYVEAYH